MVINYCSQFLFPAETSFNSIPRQLSKTSKIKISTNDCIVKTSIRKAKHHSNKRIIKVKFAKEIEAFKKNKTKVLKIYSSDSRFFCNKSSTYTVDILSQSGST